MIVKENSNIDDYVNHEEQTITFPLKQGQVLHKGDYLDDDGIHRKVRELNLAIADMDNSEEYPGWTNLTQVKEDYNQHNTNLNGLCNFKCNIVGENNWSVGINTLNNNSTLFLFKSKLGLTQTEWKEQYPDLVVQIQYELENEEIESYTEEQQKIYNKIKELCSYYGTTHITCEDEISCIFDIEYVQDHNLVRQNDKQELEDRIQKVEQAIVALGGV